MAFDINRFRQNLDNHDGLAKADKFDVIIPLPAAIAQDCDMETLSLLAEVSELPGRDIQMVEYRHYSFIQRLPHMNNYGLASFIFICTGDFVEKRLFDRWLDYMLPAQTGLVTYPINNDGSHAYDVDITINQYNMTDTDPMYQVQLIEAIPVSVSALNQSWDNDAMHKLSVSFAFKKWLSSETQYQFKTDFAQVNPSVNSTSTGSTTSGTNNITNAN